jgi:hypothetical protein
MSENQKEVSSGISVLGMLIFTVFLVLKLIGVSEVADWSWWWVTSPLWLPFAIVVILSISILIISGIVIGIKNLFK